MKMLGRIIWFFVKVGLGIVAIIVALVTIINLFVVLSAQPRIYDAQELVTSEHMNDEVPVLVLGAGVINNEYPSDILQLRLDKAYDLYELNPDKQFIMSGDHREDNYNEVAVMKQYLIDKGIPSSQIYLDHAGYSTYDSMYRLKNVIGVDQVIVVTQGYHLPRALMNARGLDIDAVGVAAGESESTRLERELREVFARLKDFAITYLGYESTQRPATDYSIDLQESGNLSDDKECL